MGVRWINVFGVAVLVAGAALTACGSDSGGDAPDNKDLEPTADAPITGAPSVNTANAIHEACTLLPGDSTQVNLTSAAAGAPLITSATSYYVIASEGPAGWTGYFAFNSDGGDVVFSIDTSAVTLELPQGSPAPTNPTFVVTSGGGTVSASEAVAAPLECDAVAGAYRYVLPAGGYQVLVNPTAWYKFRLVVSNVD